MSFAGKNRACLNALLALAASVTTASLGTAESPTTRLTAGVTLGGGIPVRRATGAVWFREQRFRVMFSYRVGTDEAGAELALADAVDLFCDAVLADPTIGGLVNAAEVDHSLADSPEYSEWAAQERRRYPVQVTLLQGISIP